MLVPLETLEGWPAAAKPGALEVLGLLIGLPIAATVLIVIYVALTGKRERRLAYQSKVVEPLWLGGGDHAGSVQDSGVEPATSTKAAALRSGASDESTGGASARW
jgi:hypothetical protein